MAKTGTCASGAEHPGQIHPLQPIIKVKHKYVSPYLSSRETINDKREVWNTPSLFTAHHSLPTYDVRLTTYHLLLTTYYLLLNYQTAPQCCMQGSVCFNFNLSIETIFLYAFVTGRREKERGCEDLLLAVP